MNSFKIGTKKKNKKKNVKINQQSEHVRNPAKRVKLLFKQPYSFSMWFFMMLLYAM